jgi:plastocyanin
MAVALSTALACGGGSETAVEERAATPLDRTTTGTITGTVLFQGTPPAMGTLPVGAEPVCAAQHAGPVPAGDVLVHDGRVQNVFVYVKDGLAGRVFAIPKEPVTIDQKGCVYVPHVAGARVGQSITFVNSDPLLHNVHGTPDTAKPWNFGMSVQGSRRSVTVDKPDVMVDVRCDVHPWMHAYVGVLDHPYFAVTPADGRFALADVPPGDYTVATWHERFGTRQLKVTVGPRETKDVSFTYTP